MNTQTIDLYAVFGRERCGAEGGYLAVYARDDLTEMPKKRVRPAMLIIPGGGYSIVSEREGEPIALRYLAEGFQCFVLQYSVAPCCYPVQLLEAGMAMLYLRREAARYGVDEQHIAAIGFSAGGHLAGCLGVAWEDAALREAFGDACAHIRPDALVLSYPVITSDERCCHGGSFRNFCADRVPHEAFSLEKRAGKGAPPCFLWATTPDDCVPVENSLLMYSALRKAGASVELHVFEAGWHGLSTADMQTIDGEQHPFLARVAQWLPLSVTFLGGHGFLVRQTER